MNVIEEMQSIDFKDYKEWEYYARQNPELAYEEYMRLVMYRHDLYMLLEDEFRKCDTIATNRICRLYTAEFVVDAYGKVFCYLFWRKIKREDFHDDWVELSNSLKKSALEDDSMLKYKYYEELISPDHLAMNDPLYNRTRQYYD